MDIGQISINAPSGIRERLKRFVLYAQWRWAHRGDEFKRERIAVDDVREACKQLEIDPAGLADEGDDDPIFILYLDHRRQAGLKVWMCHAGHVSEWATAKYGHVYQHAFTGAWRLSANGVDPTKLILSLWSGLAPKRRILEAIADGLSCRAAFLEKGKRPEKPKTVLLGEYQSFSERWRT